MSCDYGFYCLDCDDMFFAEYTGSYSIFDALKSHAELAELGRVMQKVRSSPCDEVLLSGYWTTDMNDMVDFFAKHDKHHLFVIDEYENTYDTETQKRHEVSKKKPPPLTP